MFWEKVKHSSKYWHGRINLHFCLPTLKLRRINIRQRFIPAYRFTYRRYEDRCNAVKWPGKK